MRYLFSALLAFGSYAPVTRALADTDFFSFMQSLMDLAPEVAASAGLTVIWPAIFIMGCLGVVDVVLGLVAAPVGFLQVRSINRAATASSATGV